LEFEFSGHQDIQIYIKRINQKYSLSRGGADVQYFLQCSETITNKVASLLKLIFEGKIKSDENDEWELQYIKATKRGIEQTIIALSRWPTLPDREKTEIAFFMKEDLKLYKDEYQFFDQWQMRDLLRLQHCECLWKLLHRKYVLKEGKWSQLPSNISGIFNQPLTIDKVKNELRQWVNACDVDDMLRILTEWKSFAVEKLTESIEHIIDAGKYKLSMFLNLSTNFKSRVYTFPEQIMLKHCVSAFEIAVHEFGRSNDLNAVFHW